MQDTPDENVRPKLWSSIPVDYAPYRKSRFSRSTYMITVYCLTLVYILLALLQWEFVVLKAAIANFLINHCFIGTILFAIAVVLLTLFIFIQKIRYTKVLNWFTTLLTVELFIIGTATLVSRLRPLNLLLNFVIVVFLVALFLLLGSFIGYDLTAHLAVLILLSVILHFLSVFFIMLSVVHLSRDYEINWDTNMVYKLFLFYEFAVLIIIIVLMLVMYHAQLIRGWRYAELRATDGLVASLILFCHFLVIFMLTCTTQVLKER